MSKHLFFEKDDAGVPKAILDRNGDVVLGMCKACGQAEGDLEDACPMHGIEPFKKTMGRYESYNGQSYAETEIAELRAKLDEMQSRVDHLVGFQNAFFEVASIFGFTAQPNSPKDVWEGQMRPRLREAAYAAAGMDLLQIVSSDRRVNTDSFREAIVAARSNIGPHRPDWNCPEDEWHWDKLTQLLDLITMPPKESFQ